MDFIKKWKIDFPYFLIGFIVVYFLLSHPPVNSSDAHSYLTFYEVRPPLYPIYLWFFHWTSYQIYLAVLGQTILFFSTLLYARYWLRKNLYVDDSIFFIITLIALLPAAFHFINVIESEPLAVPLFLISFFLLIDCLIEFNIKKLFWLTFTVTLLILCRSQFFYFYGFFILWPIWHLWQKTPLKNILQGLLVIILSIFVTIGSDKSYHYFMHGTFGGAPALGEQLLVQPLYLANTDAVNYFTDKIEKEHITKLLEIRNAKKISFDYYNSSLTAVPPDPGIPISPQLSYELFNTLYVPLQFVIKELKATPHLTIQKYDAELIHIAKVLYRHDYKKNIIFFCTKWTQSLGGIPIFLCFVLLLMAFGLKVIFSTRWRPSIQQIFILMVVLTIFVNNAVIAIVEEGASRYFFYSYFLLWFLAVHLVSRLFVETNNSKDDIV